MATLDPVAVINALKQEVSAESDAVKACMTLIEQLVAEIAQLKAVLAVYESQLIAVADGTTSLQVDTQSLNEELKKYTASGQPNV